MRLLVDTNVYLEVILEQEKSEEARNLLARTESYEFFVSDYSLHSIGVLLFRRKQHDVFWEFVKDMMLNAGTMVVTLSAKEMENVVESAQRFNLDFDDAYQYAVAEKYNLTIVSFDADFDKTKRGKRMPAKILES